MLKKDEPCLYYFAENSNFPDEEAHCVPGCRIEHGQNVSLRIRQVLQSGHTISSGDATHTPDQHDFMNPTPTPTNILKLDSTNVEYTDREVRLQANTSTDTGTGFGLVYICDMNDESCVIPADQLFCSNYSLDCTLKQPNGPRICPEV